jgi:polysaccharide pyruvyl transferase WcaK-like protein
MKVLLLGYYGHRNFGDDLLMKLCLERLRNHPSISRLAVTSHPAGREYVHGIFPEINQIETLEKGLTFLRNYDRVIFGGGGTVFEYREKLSLRYYLQKKISDFRYYGRAARTGTRFAAIGLGIGPFADQRAESIAMNRLRYHDFLFTRDQPSYEIAKRCKLRNVQLSHDLCFLDADQIAEIRRSLRPESDRPISFIVRHFKYGDHGNGYFPEMVKAADSLEKEGHHIRWIAFQPNYDEPVVQELESRKQDVWVWNPESMSFRDAYQFLGESRVIVTARMHGTYLAGMLNVPSVNVALHPKLDLAAKQFRNAAVVPALPTAEQIFRATEEMLKAKTDAQAFDDRRVNSDMAAMWDRVNKWIAD